MRASGGKSEPEQCGGIALALRGGHNALCEQGKCRRWPACIAVEVRRWQSPQFLPRHSRSHRRAECVRTFDLVGEGYCPPIIIKHKNADGLRVMSYLKARLSVRWPSIREHRLAKGGWVSENAGALLCKTSRRFGDLCCFPSMTCPTRAFCTGRTSKKQAIFLVAILVPVTAWLWLLAVLDAVAAPTAGRAARLCPLSGVAVELQIQTRE